MVFIQRVNAVFADVEEQVLDMMCDFCNRSKFKHGRGALDRVHTSKNLVDVILRETLVFLRVDQQLIQIHQQGIRFKQVCVQ